MKPFVAFSKNASTIPYMYVHTHLYIFVHTCMCVTYTHTHTHTHRRTRVRSAPIQHSSPDSRIATRQPLHPNHQGPPPFRPKHLSLVCSRDRLPPRTHGSPLSQLHPQVIQRIQGSFQKVHLHSQRAQGMVPVLWKTSQRCPGYDTCSPQSKVCSCSPRPSLIPSLLQNRLGMRMGKSS